MREVCLFWFLEIKSFENSSLKSLRSVKFKSYEIKIDLQISLEMDWELSI